MRPAPTRREIRYEGFPLEAVLARVHETHGADASITSADRVRRGGIGGFFAREVFQVTVVVEHRDEIDADANAGHDTDDLHFVPLGRMSIFGDDRPVVLDDGPDATPSDTALSHDLGSDLGFDTDDIDPEDIPGALGLTAERDPADAEIWELLAQAALRAEDTRSAEATAPVASAARVAAPAPAPASTPVPAGDAHELVDAGDVQVVAPIRSTGPIASTRLVPSPFEPVRPSASPSTPVTSVFPPSAEGIAHQATLAPAEVEDLPSLIARFEPHWRAPAPPAAGVIAVVGARAEALGVAGALADALGLAPDDVVVATPSADLAIPTADEAVRLAAATRFRCRPVAVIVVELLPGRQGHEWARVVLEGLRAEQVRYAVDTSALVGQQHRGIAAIGGADVVDLVRASECDDPEAALAATAPVGTIDGRAATPEMWAATVLAARERRRTHQPIREHRSVVS